MTGPTPQVPSWLDTNERPQRTASSDAALGSPGLASIEGAPVIVQDRVLVNVACWTSSGDPVPDATEPRWATARATLRSADACVVVLRPLHVPEERFDLREQWEGAIQEIQGDEVVVVLRDLTDPSRPEEEAVIGSDEISDDDRPLVSPGAIFYWSIGYRTSRSGQVERVSAIRFRRLPAWSRRDVARIEKRTAQCMEAFGV